MLLIVASFLGIAGYFATTYSWERLHEIKGPEWFGEQVDATVVRAASFTETSWQSGADNPDYRHRDLVAVKYEFEVDGKSYGFPYENGYAEVTREMAKESTVPVYYLPESPANNYPTSKDYKYADQMTGTVFGALLLLGCLALVLLFVKGMVFGVQREAVA